MAEAGKRELPAAAESTVAADGGSAPPIKSQKIIALVGVNAGRVACVSVLQREGIKMPPVRQVIIGFVLLVAVIAVAKFLNSGASIYDRATHRRCYERSGSVHQLHADSCIVFAARLGGLRVQSSSISEDCRAQRLVGLDRTWLAWCIAMGLYQWSALG